MKSLLAVPALLLAVNSWADCPTVMPSEAPPVPDGKSASYTEMREAQRAVADYVNGIETFLECRPQLHALAHNRAIDLAETAADAYNDALASFRQRDVMLADN
ncbi:hypothetical protein [Kineobactrum salinum]|uniref:Uncharacterized protein n=1 Tax=Kineobactrum salinum TaxID=2708301 RepID=A0A6C0U309_9GAMM|nr:hypothetical protein [Kineobactrum salinum]QIB64755.1 hypothetical protein G3T16_04500 [Kineobactrum salinum]